jgi:hypothetical protein
MRAAQQTEKASPTDPELVRKIIHILINSRFYFDLTLKERYDLIRYILTSFPFPV